MKIGIACGVLFVVQMLELPRGLADDPDEGPRRVADAPADSDRTPEPEPEPPRDTDEADDTRVADAPDTGIERKAASEEEGPIDTSGLSEEEIDALLLEQALESQHETIHIEADTRVTPGSAHTVTEEELERFEHDDVHRVLGSVPGVYMREEDGYGLRPNIGMRGSGTERSSKIALLEDGILIAPAPYAAPAAYYFPMLTRMRSLEVAKGPAAIRHGPNTVGGALNLVSAPIPVETTAEIDTAVGANRYGKLHAGFGDSFRHYGYWVEGVKLRSDGFKQLDGGGNTGFDKNDLLAKFRLNTAPDRPMYQQVEVKVGYSDEDGNETYTGLSRDDFAARPYRRYAATQLDHFDSRHFQTQIAHTAEFGPFDLATTLYRNTYYRDWNKLNGFSNDRNIDDVLDNPDAGANSLFYGILTGTENSTGSAENLILGSNDRRYLARGVQSVAKTTRDFLAGSHEVSVGARLHLDTVRRMHTEDTYAMQDGRLERTDDATMTNLDSRASARAWALFAQDAATYGDLTVTGGLRTELVATEWIDRADPMNNSTDFFSVLIPGAGVFYRLTDHLGALGGVHRGFVPVAPGQDPSVEPEKSVNYEAGMRWSSANLRAEAIGFFNDYSNLKGNCSFSQGCTAEMEIDEFNGNSVHVGGVETLVGSDIPAGGKLWVPVKLTYTYNRSQFQESFMSPNPQWGNIQAGYELPYMPRHQASATVGVRTERAEVAGSARHNGAMRDQAGSGGIATEEKIPAYTVFDLAGSLGFGSWGRGYVTVDNVLGRTYVVSLRPIGARPGKPRTFMVGYKNSF